MQITLQEKISDAELTAIQRIAPFLQEQDVFTFPVKMIDDSPTANNRVWTVEWQRANAENFVGIPVVLNHGNDAEKIMGRVYEAEQRDNAIYGKFFSPLTTETGRDAKDNIQGGLFKSVSINARSENTEQDGDLTRILPGANDRIYELSFVAVAGCETCTVQTESANSPCGCEAVQTEHEDDKWDTYVKDVREKAIAAVLKSAAFVFGESFNEPTYRTLAGKLAPQELETLTSDLRETYTRLHEPMQESQQTPQSEWKPLGEVLRKNRSNQ